ncbi:MAG: FIST C-terminal domain-containing protein [Sedimentisphaerales bacterium]|nr:FIST C-terminal domain-containing protein [Sedimentisphaerales bacterium]
MSAVRRIQTIQTLFFLGAVLFWAFPAPLDAEPLTMAHGWSVNPQGGTTAAEEAIAMMQRTVPNPRFIVLFTTADYGEQEIVQTLRGRFPQAKLFGMNVYKGVFSSDGLHVGEKGSLAIMGYAGGNLVFGISAKSVDDDADVTALTKQAIRDAIQDAGMTEKDKPSLILLGATKGKEDAIVRGIDEAIPDDIPLVGGTHCNDVFGQGYVIENDKLFKPGLIVGLIYSQSKIGASFYSGFIGKKKSGKITAGDGRILKEIEGRPALDVYREWSGGYFDDIDCSKESVIVMSSAVCPLAKAIQLPNGTLRYIPVRPWKFNPDGSLNMGGDIRNGDDIYYVEGNKKALRIRAGVVTRDAMVNGKIKVKNIIGGLHIYCGGAAKTLGFGQGEQTSKMVGEIQNVMDGKPFIGGFTAGEQGYIPGYGYFHGNLMSSMVVFSQEEDPAVQIATTTAP